MDQQKKKRSENWSTEEKDILREMIAQSRHIIEAKCTKASSNTKKAQEWKNIAKRMYELTGRNRSDSDVKLAWKRMKLSAKANLSAHRQHIIKTGGGEKPKSPSQEDLAIMDIAPHDFVVEYNNYDSDAITSVVELHSPNRESETTAGPSTDFPPLIIPPKFDDEIQVKMDQGTSNVKVGSTPKTTPKTTPKKKGKIRKKNDLKNIKETMQDAILKSNIEFKEKQLYMLEMEHQYNIKIAKLKIKKLELEIDLLENRNNSTI